MSVPIISNFDIRSKLPIDSRTVRLTIADRNAIPIYQRYIGLTVYVIDEFVNYQLQGGITNSNWTALDYRGGNPIATISTLGVVKIGTGIAIAIDGTISCSIPPSNGITVWNDNGFTTSITDNSSNWNTAYGWGNHASVGYLTSVTQHNLLSTTHSDTVTGSVSRGDVLIGNSSSKWDRLAKGSEGKILRANSTDIVYSTSTFADTYPINQLLYASSANTVTGLAVSTTVGTFLRNTTVGGIPAWSTLVLPNSGTVGDIPYVSSTNTVTMLTSVATAGSFVRGGGSTTAPKWSSVKLPDTMSALGLWVANSLNTTVNLTASANQSIRVNSGGTAWESYTPVPSASPSFTTSIGTASASFDLVNTTVGTLNFAGSATVLNVGGTPTTAITHSYSTNATATGTTKTVYFGTGGATGSTTNIYIGSSVSGATSNIFMYGAVSLNSTITALNVRKTAPTTLNSGTPAWDMTVSSVAHLTLTGSVSLTISNAIAGDFGTLKVIQGSGSYTLTLPAGSKKTSTIAISTTNGAIDILSFYYDGTNYFWNQAKNYT